jgi:hypothetical protein
LKMLRLIALEDEVDELRVFAAAPVEFEEG